MDIDYISIGKRIKIARKKQHLTQEQLAEMADISIPYLGNMENANTSVCSGFVALAFLDLVPTHCHKMFGTCTR